MHNIQDWSVLESNVVLTGLGARYLGVVSIKTEFDFELILIQFNQNI